eukprot:2368072-Rhodomonas_salina.1
MVPAAAMPTAAVTPRSKQVNGVATAPSPTPSLRDGRYSHTARRYYCLQAVKEVVQSGAERDKQGLKRDHQVDTCLGARRERATESVPFGTDARRVRGRQNKRCSSGEVRDSAGGVQYEFSLLRGGLHPLPAAAQ